MTGVRLAFVATVLVSMVSPPTAHAARFVLAIGNNDGLPSESQLRWAESDARRIAEVFVEVGDVVPARVVTLLGKDSDILERELARLQGQVEELHRHGERAEVLITYSGHGDRESLHLGAGRYPLSLFEQRIAELGADATIVVVDSCRGAPLRSGSERGATRAPEFDVTVERTIAPNGQVRIFSASENEVAQESDDLEGAFFTHHFVAGLRGAADLDDDRQISLAELYRYVHEKTLSTSFSSQTTQHPELNLDLKGQGELVLTSLDRARTRIVLDTELQGEFLLVDERARRVLLEVKKSPDQSLSLAVPATTIRVQRRHDGRVFVGDVSLPWGGEKLVRSDDLIEVERDRVAARGATVDSSPWQVLGGIGPTMIGRAGAATGMQVRTSVARRLFDSFLLAESRQSLSLTSSTSGQLTFFDQAWRGTAGLAAEIGWGQTLWTGFMGLGAMLALQRIEGVDQADSSTTQSGWTIGPLGSMGARVAVPVWGAMFTFAEGEASLGYIVVDQAPSLEPSFGGHLGLGLEL